MPRGGARPGAGRKPGARNKKTIETVRAIEAAGITPLDYMLSVLRNENLDLATRLDAANKAAPYVHAKLANVDLKANVNVSHEDALEQLE